MHFTIKLFILLTMWKLQGFFLDPGLSRNEAVRQKLAWAQPTQFRDLF